MHTQKSEEDQIKILNTLVKIRLAPSKVHGIGVFAIRDIPKGQKIWADNMPEVFNLPFDKFNKLRPEIVDILLERYPRIVTGSAFIYPDSRMLAYMNHSDTPNYDALKDITLKDIKEGEEILEDYRKIDGWEQAFGSWLSR